MTPKVFHGLEPFRPYSNESDSKLLIFAYQGIAHEIMGLVTSLEDPERVNHISRLHYYIGGMLRVFNVRFKPDEPPGHMPDYWLEINTLQGALKELSDTYMTWCQGNEFRESKCIYCLDIMLGALYNLRVHFKIHLNTILDIAVISLKNELVTIPVIKLRYPIYGRIDLKARNRQKDEYDAFVKLTTHGKRARYESRLQKRKTPIDEAWLTCFHSIVGESYNGSD